VAIAMLAGACARTPELAEPEPSVPPELVASNVTDSPVVAPNDAGELAPAAITARERSRSMIPGSSRRPANIDECERINLDGTLEPEKPTIPGPATNPTLPPPPVVFPIGYPVPPDSSPPRKNFYEVLWQRTLETPDPSWSALKQTKWARRDRRPGCTRVHICSTVS
jgi:hypothetical protein